MTVDPAERGGLRTALLALPTAQRSTFLQQHLCVRAANWLGHPLGTATSAHTGWHELGFDSLRSVDFATELGAGLAVELRSTLLFDQPNVGALTAYLLGLLVGPEPAAPHPPRQHHADREPIAIVGAACRVPGAEDLAAYWQLLLDGRCAITAIPPERLDPKLFDPDPDAEGKVYVRHAGLLRDIDRFDAAFFGISPREAAQIDPQQRLLLEVGWHALEHANLPPAALREQRVGVYVGTRASEYLAANGQLTAPAATAWSSTGNAASTAAGRLAYTFGFTGPCYSLDTACSGSLVAVHVAVRALRAGECDTALAGGVSAVFDQAQTAGLCRARMLSPDGLCKSFDAAADGYGRGEGCGLVVLRRLRDAEAAGDTILGVVHGTAINQDGRSSGLTVPNGGAQTAVIREALADAALSPNAIDFVEAHGTGTSLGDPIEVQALDAAFAGRDRPLRIGSVKTNIGHLEPAAGITSLLKALLALRARTLPATLHFTTPNPHIDWARSCVQVVTARTALPATGTLHAGVSSFGYSGTNCHVVLGSWRSPPDATATPNDQGPWQLPLHAADRGALRALAAAHADALAHTDVDLRTWCRTAAAARAVLPERAVFHAASHGAMVAALRAFARGDEAVAATHGDAVDAEVARPVGPWQRAQLPLYPFQRQHHWLDPKPAVSTASTSTDVLGERLDSSLLAADQRVYRTTLASDRPTWLADHQVQGQVVFPLTAMLEQALAAESRAGTRLPFALHGVIVHARCTLGASAIPSEFVAAGAAVDGTFTWQTQSPAGTWQRHCSGRRGPATCAAPFDPRAIAARCHAIVAPMTLYERCAQRQLTYGPNFRNVRSLRLGEHAAYAEVSLPDHLASHTGVLHPALLDACLHPLVLLLGGDDAMHLPTALDSLVVHRRGAQAAVSHVLLRAGNGATRTADVVLTDANGDCLATLRGLQLTASELPKGRASATPAADIPDWAALPAAARTAVLHALLRERIAKVLGFPDAALLHDQRTFREFGLDSLLAIDAQEELEVALGVKLPATLLFDQPDLRRLTAHVSGLLSPPSQP